MKGILPILVVEDQIEEQKRIKNALGFLKIPNPLYFALSRKDGFARLEEMAGNGASKFPQLPGLIILDFHLDNGTAFEMLQELKTHAVYNQIPVIIFSDTDLAPDLAACYALGCNGYFLKPGTEEGYHKLMEVIYNFWFEAVAIPYVVERRLPVVGQR